MKNRLLTLALFCAITNGYAQMAKQPSDYQKVTFPVSSELNQKIEQAQRTAPNSGTITYSTNSINSSMIAKYIPYGASMQQQFATFAGIGTNGGSVAFAFKQAFSCSGTNPQALSYNLSTDGGLTWLPPQGNCFGNSPLTASSNYTNANYHATPILHSELGTTTNDLHLIYAGRAVDNANSNVHFLTGAATNLAAGTAPLISQEDYTQTAYKSFAMNKRVEGEFWAAGITTANVLEIRKGNWNNATNTIAWNLAQSINMDNILAVDVNGFKHLFEVKIAFSPNGNNGYVVMNGDLQGGWNDCSNAIICEYDANTGNFNAPYEISFNNFPDVVSNVTQYVSSPGTPISDRASIFNFQITVDHRGALHLNALTLPSGGDASHVYTGFATRLYDLSKSPTNTWGLIDVTPISKAKAEIGSGANMMQYYTFANVSRSADGHYIFFTWADTDTLGIGNFAALDAPNLKGKIYDVTNNLISPEIDFTTSDPSWANIARLPKTAEVALMNGTFTVPTFVTRFFGTPTITDPDAAIKEAEFHYFSNVQYTASQATIPVIWKANTLALVEEMDLKNVSLYPNPATQSSILTVELPEMQNLTISVLNVHGQVVLERELPNSLNVREEIKLQNWAKGIYYVKVSSNLGVATRKLVVE